MTATNVRRRMTELRQHWTPAERKRREQISRRRCAELLAILDRSGVEASHLWAGGAMTVSDLARIAG